ncbi:MAG TPA: hypothetical protein VG370_12885, partial [Chloroflexota bacterium]|nr:hypothetical protein [Chloroflexota bacterium]
MEIPLPLDHVFVLRPSSRDDARRRPPLIWIGLVVALVAAAAAGWWLARPRSEEAPSVGAELALTSTPSGAVVL